MLSEIYGAEAETKMLVGWRLFFLTLVECFALDGGNEWIVAHYRFRKPEK
jgi:cyclopropane-fatty-acyl-phospholipid synthase